jgi:hypothetical protein
MKTFSREFDSQDTTQLRVHHQITKHHNLIKRYYYEPSKLLKKTSEYKSTTSGVERNK